MLCQQLGKTHDHQLHPAVISASYNNDLGRHANWSDVGIKKKSGNQPLLDWISSPASQDETHTWHNY